MACVRAKFKVDSITRFAYSKGATVMFSPVYSDDPASENRAFWTATPSGRIEMAINNPASADVFELGREYYVDFTATAPVAPKE